MKIILNEILQSKNKSLYWLSNETNIRYATLHKIVKGQTVSIKFDNLEKICIALNCTPNDILKIER